jgi:hypothetical protein
MTCYGRGYARPSSQTPRKRGAGVPRDFAEGPEDRKNSEHEEIEEHAEVDETETSAREIIREAAEEAVRLEQEEQPLNQVIRELEEIEAAEEKAKEVLEDTIHELQGLEEDLGHKIDEVREELHDKFVNDTESKLEGPSLKYMHSESEEAEEDGESAAESTSEESYIEGGDGTIYVIETAGSARTEVSSESELDEQPETENASTLESNENAPDEQEIVASSEFRNCIVKADEHESIEDDEVMPSSPEKRDVSLPAETDDEQCLAEADLEEPKREQREQEVVIEDEDVEKVIRNEPVEVIDDEAVESKHEFPEPEQEFQKQETDEMDELDVPSDYEEREQDVIKDADESLDVSQESNKNDDALEHNRSEASEDIEHAHEDEEQELPDEVSEELIQKIEEMLNQLESLKEEEVDESRVIVEAMTGKKHIDRSLEPRPYFAESEEDIERQERERVREKVAGLFKALPEKEREKFKERVRAKLGNEEDLNAWIRENPSVKVSPDFKQNYEDAKRYIKTRKKGEAPRLIRELWILETERCWTQAVNIVVQKRLNKHFQKSIGRKRKAKQIKIESTGIAELVRITECRTLEDYERLLERHPYLRDIKDFLEQDRRARAYFKMKRILNQSPEISDYKLAKELGVGHYSVFLWRKGKRGGKPLIISRLLKNEALRYQYEVSLSKDALKYRLDPSAVYCIVRDRCSNHELTPKLAATILRELQALTKNHLSFAEFKPYNIYGPKNVLRFVDYLRANLKRIQQELDDLSKERGEERLRVGLAADKFYLREDTPSESLHFDFIRSELFYFDKRVKTRLIRNAMDRLGGIGQFWLSRLVRQLTDLGPSEKIPQHGENNDVRFENRFLRGETLHFLLQANEMEFSEIQAKIKWIGERKQIRAPQFLDNTEFLEWITRVIAIMSSDGFIAKDYQTGYYEKNEFRRHYVKHLFTKLGILSLLDSRDTNGNVNGFGLPSVVGRLLVKCGFPVGDRTLQGFKIPSFIIDGPIEIRSAYLQETIPEDGWITYMRSDNRIAIGIGRTSVLYDPKKGKILREIDGGKLAELIEKYGTKVSRFQSKRKNYVILSMIQLEKLTNSENRVVSTLAQHLEKFVHENFPQHLLDEQQILEKMGISSSPYIESISLSIKTSRISIQYKIMFSESKYVARFGLLAMPKDRIKKAKFLSWMKRNSGIVQEEKVRLSKAGFLNEKEESPEGSPSV